MHKDTSEVQAVAADIHARIKSALAAHHLSTGKPATRIYLGKYERDVLMQWARDNQYISRTDMRTGEHRPEVMGLPVFEVNDDQHCFAA